MSDDWIRSLPTISNAELHELHSARDERVAAQMAALSEGHCPNHPDQRLVMGTVTQYGRTIHGGKCPVEENGGVYQMNPDHSGWHCSYQLSGASA